MKKLKFWWYYITDPSFRYHVHLHEIQKYQDDLKHQMEEKLRYEVLKMYKDK